MNDTVSPHLPEFIRFGRAICGDLAQAERREWWLTNGLGAYAAGTIAGSLTRRYHGLLVAPLQPPLGRHLVLAKADATLHDGEREWPLFTNRWASGAVAPQGHLHLQSFRLEGRMPVWRFALGDALVEQRVWMEPGAHTTYIAWRLVALLPDDTRTRQLRAKILVNGRDHHGSTRPGDFHPRLEVQQDQWQVTYPQGWKVYFQAPGGTFRPEPVWIENFDLPLERERGLHPIDAHLCIGEAQFTLVPGEWAGIVTSLQEDASPSLPEAMERFKAHDRAVLKRARKQALEFPAVPAWIEQLVLAADSFVCARPLPDVPDGESVIAGYPWFGDWGRDTMIALPGLTLATGRHASARRILETFARFVDEGMLPNVFPGAGERAEYNTVDAALWYLEAWRAYVEGTADRHALAKAFPVLEAIVDWHRRGTRYRIGMDSADGLLHAGEPGVQITWMDAKIGDWVVTPRIGKPVEINALWYNALCAMDAFARMLHRDGTPYRDLAERVRLAFQRFVKPEAGLRDVLDGPAGDDGTVRPNQIFAVSLAHSPLGRQEQRRVVVECARELLGSYGLRSLAPTHPEYRPRYQGGVWERDSAYHQGPLWGWLLGPFALALYRVFDDPLAAQQVLEPVRDHLFDAGLGTVSEIFDGDAPHAPRGAPAQAWSVACVLEAWWRLERARGAGKPRAEEARVRSGA